MKLQYRDWHSKAYFQKTPLDQIVICARRVGIELCPNLELPEQKRGFDAFVRLPKEDQTRLQQVLIPINDMCGEHARPFLRQLGRDVWGNPENAAVGDFRAMPSHKLAIMLFLADSVKFDQCRTRFGIVTTSKRREYQGAHSLDVPITGEQLAALKALLRRHYSAEYGEDVRCHIDDCPGNRKKHLLVYAEKDMVAGAIFDENDEVRFRWARMLARIVIVFDADTGLLQIKSRSHAECNTICDHFEKTCIGEKGYFVDTSKSTRFNLRRVLDEGFCFTTRPSDGIDSIRITQFSYTHFDGYQTYHSTQKFCDGPLSPEELVSFLHRRDVPLASIIKVTDLGLHVLFAGRGRIRDKTFLIDLNGAELNDTERDNRLRDLLKELRIDIAPTNSAMALSASNASMLHRPPDHGGGSSSRAA